jgi:hypothetical protein
MACLMSTRLLWLPNQHTLKIFLPMLFNEAVLVSTLFPKLDHNVTSWYSQSHQHKQRWRNCSSDRNSWVRSCKVDLVQGYSRTKAPALASPDTIYKNPLINIPSVLGSPESAICLIRHLSSGSHARRLVRRRRTHPPLASHRWTNSEPLLHMLSMDDLVVLGWLQRRQPSKTAETFPHFDVWRVIRASRHS